MNFLAHIFLSQHNEDWMIGNLIADFICNRDLDGLNVGVREGVLMHRQIDTFTDSHPVVKKSVRRLSSDFYRYSPVVSDIFYDYLLIRNWQNYTAHDFDEFCHWAYEIMHQRMEEIPPRLKENLPQMIAHNWLKDYGTAEGLQFTFDRFAKRVTFEADFSNAAEILIQKVHDLNEDFNQFFPDLVDYVHRDLKDMTAGTDILL